MEPRYSVTAYAFAAFVAGTLANLMAVSWAPIAAGAIVTGWSGALWLNYQRWRLVAKRAGRLRRSSRDQLDRFALGQWLVAGIALLVMAIALDVEPLSHAPELVKTIAACVTLGACLLLVSAHVDWYWILPRVSGVIRSAPCEFPAEW